MLPDVGQLAVSQAQKYKLCHKKQIEEKARPGREWNHYKTMLFGLMKNLMWDINITTLFVRHVGLLVFIRENNYNYDNYLLP